MATTITACIDSALDDVELLVKARPSSQETKVLKIWRFKLRNLKTFVLSAKKLGDDVSLESILIWIEDTIGRNAGKIHSTCLDLNNPDTYKASYMVSKFREDIESLEEEIDEWYISMFDYTRQSSSPTLTTFEVLEIISSILENLLDIYDFRSTDVHFEILGEGLEALREQLTFLKSLTCFVTQASVETREELLKHTEAVAINAAYLLFTCKVDKFDEEKRKGMQFKISLLLQKIMPINPQVSEIYTQVLRSSKLSRRPVAPYQDNMDVDAHSGMKSFLDSLVSNLWEMLQSDTINVVSLKYHLQELYRGLRSLRTLLKQQPNHFSMHIEEDIGAVVCDAGVIICSLYQTQVELGLQNLSETIKIVLANVGEKDPQVPTFNFWRSNDQLGFIDILLKKLMELVKSYEAEPSTRSCLQTIQEELAFLRSFLGGNVEVCNEHKELRALWDCVLEVAYRIGCLTDHLEIIGDLPDSFPLLSGSIGKDIMDVVKADVSNAKAEVLKIFYDNRREIKVNEVTTNCSERRPSQSISTITHDFVGRQDEIQLITDRLTGGSRDLCILTIVGMPGIGKTTLATRVYNDPSILNVFDIRAWCCISQEVDKNKVLLDLLSQIDHHPERCSEYTEDDNLCLRLRSNLKGRQYLIVLDDIWDDKAWDVLESSFPNENGSRILLTSRTHHLVPPHMIYHKPHFLGLLSREESVELFERISFPRTRNDWPPELWELGMQIVDKCAGLPLAIAIVARLVATSEPNGCKDILDGLSSGVISIAQLCMKTFEPSYKHLPDCLKACFLYFATFPKDQEVPVRRLLRLWIAEGFVEKDLVSSPEYVAESYLEDLIGASLLIAATQRSDGGVKTCRVHSLLHDFCMQKAKDEKFFHFVKGYDELLEFNEQPNLWRLCIESKPEHFKESKLFCPHTRSLLFNCSKGEELLADVCFVIHSFKLVAVLDLEHINLGRVFPREIQGLVQLVFLAIRGEMSCIPSSSVANLSNLETFIVDPGTKILSLPANLRDLQKLKYLYVRSCASSGSGGGTMPRKTLDGSSVSHGLVTLSGLVVPSWGNLEKLMRKFPYIRKLKCKQDKDDTEDLDKIVVDLDFLTQLESLHMSSLDGFLFEFSFPEKLKKLTLSGFHLQSRKISAIGKMPNLQVLKLLDVSFAGKTWEIKEEEFLELRFLKLRSSSLVRWRAGASSDDEYYGYRLEKLVLDGCGHLEEMPSSLLENIFTLQMIEARDCSTAVFKCLNRVQEVHIMEFDNPLNINIQSSSPSGSGSTLMIIDN